MSGNDPGVNSQNENRRNKIDDFLTEIRNLPKFIAAASVDPKWITELENLGICLDAIDRKADSLPEMIDILDQIELVVGRADLSAKQRLVELGKILCRARAVTTGLTH